MSETTAPAVTLVEFLERMLDERESGWKAHKRREDEGDEEKLYHFGQRLADELLTDIQVKRRILQLHRPVDGNRRCRCCLGTLDPLPLGPQYPCETLRLLALPYAGHEAYNPAWRPE